MINVSMQLLNLKSQCKG